MDKLEKRKLRDHLKKANNAEVDLPKASLKTGNATITEMYIYRQKMLDLLDMEKPEALEDFRVQHKEIFSPVGT